MIMSYLCTSFGSSRRSRGVFPSIIESLGATPSNSTRFGALPTGPSNAPRVLERTGGIGKGNCVGDSGGAGVGAALGVGVGAVGFGPAVGGGFGAGVGAGEGVGAVGVGGGLVVVGGPPLTSFLILDFNNAQCIITLKARDSDFNLT